MTVPATDLSPATSSFDPQDFIVPTGREELWRFTPMRRLRGLQQEAANRGGVTYTPGAGAGKNVAVVDRDDPALAQAAAPTDRIAALAWANFDQAAVVSVAPGEAVAEPLLLTVRADGQQHSFGQVVVDCGADASATVVIDHTGSGAYAGTTTIRVGDGARVTVAVLQQMPRMTIVQNQPNYIRAESRSPFWGFIDDNEFYFDAELSVIEVRAAARLGHSDLDKNRQRIEEIRAKFQTTP